jgi:hypothetical protein
MESGIIFHITSYFRDRVGRKIFLVPTCRIQDPSSASRNSWRGESSPPPPLLPHPRGIIKRLSNNNIPSIRQWKILFLIPWVIYSIIFISNNVKTVLISFWDKINFLSGDSVVKHYNKIKRQNVCLHTGLIIVLSSFLPHRHHQVLFIQKQVLYSRSILYKQYLIVPIRVKAS